MAPSPREVKAVPSPCQAVVPSPRAKNPWAGMAGVMEMVVDARAREIVVGPAPVKVPPHAKDAGPELDA